MEGGLRGTILDTISADAVDPADPVDPVDPVACSKSVKSDRGLFKNRLWSSQRPARASPGLGWPSQRAPAEPKGPIGTTNEKNVEMNVPKSCNWA